MSPPHLWSAQIIIAHTPLTFLIAHPDPHSQLYSNLFFLLQAEPRHVASLCRMVNLSEIDTLLQTVMFTLYGNQYESREEHLLLTMFQVRHQAALSRRTELSMALGATRSRSWQRSSKWLPSSDRCCVQTRPYPG